MCAYFPVSISDLPKSTSLKSSTEHMHNQKLPVGRIVTNLPLVDLYGFVISRQPWESHRLTRSMVHGQHKQNGT